MSGVISRNTSQIIQDGEYLFQRLQIDSGQNRIQTDHVHGFLAGIMRQTSHFLKVLNPNRFHWPQGGIGKRAVARILDPFQMTTTGEILLVVVVVQATFEVPEGDCAVATSGDEKLIV